MKILRTTNLGLNFTGSYKKGCILFLREDEDKDRILYLR